MQDINAQQQLKDLDSMRVLDPPLPMDLTSVNDRGAPQGLIAGLEELRRHTEVGSFTLFPGGAPMDPAISPNLPKDIFESSNEAQALPLNKTGGDPGDNVLENQRPQVPSDQNMGKACNDIMSSESHSATLQDHLYCRQISSTPMVTAERTKIYERHSEIGTKIAPPLQTPGTFSQGDKSIFQYSGVRVTEKMQLQLSPTKNAEGKIEFKRDTIYQLETYRELGDVRHPQITQKGQMESPVKGDLCGLEQQDQLKTHTKMLRQAYRVCAKNEATIRELDDKIIFSSEPMEMQSLIQQRELLKSKTDKIEEEIVMLKQMVQKTTRELEGTNVGTSTVDDAHISNNSDVLQVSSEQHPITNIAAARRDPSSPIVISSSPEIYPAKRRKKGDEEKSTKRISKKSPRKEIESWGEFNCMFRYELSPDSQEVRDDLLQRNRRQEQERQEHDRDTDFDPYATLSDEPTNPFWGKPGYSLKYRHDTPAGKRIAREVKMLQEWDRIKNLPLDAAFDLLVPTEPKKLDLAKFWGFLLAHMGLPEAPTMAVEKRSIDAIIEMLNDLKPVVTQFLMERGPKSSRAMDRIIHARSLSIQIVDRLVVGRKARTSMGNYPEWLTEQGLTILLKDIRRSWENAAAEEETDLYDNIENPDTELTPQECRDWCSQAIQMLKVRTERIKAEVDWQLHRQQNQPAEPAPSTPAPTRRAHKKSRLAPITFPIKIPLISSLPPSSLPRYSGDSEDAEEVRGRGNHGNQRMAESEFEPMEETGGAGQAGQARRDGEVTVSRAHQTQQGDPSPRGPPQTGEDSSVNGNSSDEENNPLRWVEEARGAKGTRGTKESGEGKGRGTWGKSPRKMYRDVWSGDVSGVDTLSTSESDYRGYSDVSEQEFDPEGREMGERNLEGGKEGEQSRDQGPISTFTALTTPKPPKVPVLAPPRLLPRTATVLPSGPTPQGEYFEESPGPSSTVTSEGTEESVVEVEPERAQGQRKEPESIALVHPTPIPLPQRQSVKRKKPTTPNKEHSAETTDPCVAFLRDIDLELLVDGERPQQHHISLTADTPELHRVLKSVNGPRG
ncbi:UNVERIFIED_CONTAM: hypothetical protein K2H54_000588 [Gekko kuhli]